MDIDLLRYNIATCHACPLGELRDNTSTVAVPADAGNNYQPGGLAIMAEAPGAQESKQGKPMVGPAGSLLHDLLAEVGLARDDVVILNRIRCRPPGNKIKSKEGIAAVAACDPWLKAELDYYNPGVVLVMGGTALEILFGKMVKVTKVRGHVRYTGPDFTYGTRAWVATFHPAFVLRNHDDVVLHQMVDDVRLALDLCRRTGA